MHPRPRVGSAPDLACMAISQLIPFLTLLYAINVTTNLLRGKNVQTYDVFQNEIPANYKGPELTHRYIAVDVRGARLGNSGTKLRVTQTCQKHRALYYQLKVRERDDNYNFH